MTLYRGSISVSCGAGLLSATAFGHPRAVAARWLPRAGSQSARYHPTPDSEPRWRNQSTHPAGPPTDLAECPPEASLPAPGCCGSLEMGRPARLAQLPRSRAIFERFRGVKALFSMSALRQSEIVTNASMIFLDMPCCHCVCRFVHVRKTHNSPNGKGYTNSDDRT